MTEEQIINQNMGMVVKLAKSFKPSNLDQLDEYIQVGRIGLLKAIRKFDANRKTKFSTFAWRCIRWEISGFISNNISTPTAHITYDIEDRAQNYPLWEIMPKNLSNTEESVIQLRLAGHTFQEIGRLSGGYTKEWANRVFKKARNKILEANDA